MISFEMKNAFINPNKIKVRVSRRNNITGNNMSVGTNMKMKITNERRKSMSRSRSRSRSSKNNRKIATSFPVFF
jgi:hypothetical protein